MRLKHTASLALNDGAMANVRQRGGCASVEIVTNAVYCRKTACALLLSDAPAQTVPERHG